MRFVSPEFHRVNSIRPLRTRAPQPLSRNRGTSVISVEQSAGTRWSTTPGHDILQTMTATAPILLFVDDERPAPEGWTLVTTSAAALDFLTNTRASGTPVDMISLDHDLGGPDTTRPIVLWMCEHDWVAARRARAHRQPGRARMAHGHGRPLRAVGDTAPIVMPVRGVPVDCSLGTTPPGLRTPPEARRQAWPEPRNATL